MFEHIRHQALNQTLLVVPQTYIEEVKAKFQTANIPFSVLEDKLVVDKSDLSKIDKIIGETVLPNLLPAQFYWLLATAGLEQATNALLESLQQTDPQKYAMYQGFLKGARFYEFTKSLEMLNQALPVIQQAYSDLDLSIPTLKALWLEAAKL